MCAATCETRSTNMEVNVGNNGRCETYVGFCCYFEAMFICVYVQRTVLTINEFFFYSRSPKSDRHNANFCTVPVRVCLVIVLFLLVGQTQDTPAPTTTTSTTLS